MFFCGIFQRLLTFATFFSAHIQLHELMWGLNHGWRILYLSHSNAASHLHWIYQFYKLYFIILSGYTQIIPNSELDSIVWHFKGISKRQKQWASPQRMWGFDLVRWPLRTSWLIWVSVSYDKKSRSLPHQMATEVKEKLLRKYPAWFLEHTECSRKGICSMEI